MTLTATVRRTKSAGGVAAFKRSLPKQIAHAMNRSIASAMTALGRAVAADLRLPSNTVKGRLRVEKVTPERLRARVFAATIRIPLINFVAASTAAGLYPSRGRGRGVTARTKQRRYAHAFIAVMSSGHRGVFERTPDKYMRRQKASWTHKRQAIHELMGPSIAHVAGKYTVVAIDRYREQFTKNLAANRRFAGLVEKGA